MKAITYFGMLRSIASWSKVARELLSALARSGTAVHVYERKGFLYDAGYGLPPDLRGVRVHDFVDPVVLTFEHPRCYHYLPRSGFKVGLLVYEFTRLPDQWVDSITEQLSLVLVPSEFCRRVFVDSGVPPQRVAVLRYGVDPSCYYPRRQRRETQPFTFLSIGSPHRREGLELLLESYAQAFPQRRDVQLILKLSYLPARRVKAFEYSDLPGLLESFRARPGMPPFFVRSERLSEAEMGALYRSADVYVSLSRGEAFGLCFLEALACGLPVLAVPWGGQAEYLSSGAARLLPYRLVPTAGEEYENSGYAQQLALPDTVGAAVEMQRVLAEQREGAACGCVSGVSEHWHWSAVAEDFKRIVSARM